MTTGFKLFTEQIGEIIIMATIIAALIAALSSVFTAFMEIREHRKKVNGKILEAVETGGSLSKEHDQLGKDHHEIKALQKDLSNSIRTMREDQIRMQEQQKTIRERQKDMEKELPNETAFVMEAQKLYQNLFQKELKIHELHADLVKYQEKNRILQEELNRVKERNRKLQKEVNRKSKGYDNGDYDNYDDYEDIDI